MDMDSIEWYEKTLKNTYNNDKLAYHRSMLSMLVHNTLDIREMFEHFIDSYLQDNLPLKGHEDRSLSYFDYTKDEIKEMTTKVINVKPGFYIAGLAISLIHAGANSDEMELLEFDYPTDFLRMLQRNSDEWIYMQSIDNGTILDPGMRKIKEEYGEEDLPSNEELISTILDKNFTIITENVPIFQNYLNSMDSRGIDKLDLCDLSVQQFAKDGLHAAYSPREERVKKLAEEKKKIEAAGGFKAYYAKLDAEEKNHLQGNDNSGDLDDELKNTDDESDNSFTDIDLGFDPEDFKKNND